MSKDNNNSNLRLLGSPVNFSYRSKKKEERKNIRNRPRSALQNSCFTPDVQEKYKRPFSADTKDRATKSFTNSFCAETLQYHNTSNNLKVVVHPPTTELLGEKKLFEDHTLKLDKDICSNASDYGSEDTFISLGTKIKNKAQLGSKGKNTNQKNFIKYKNNILKRGKKSMDKVNDAKNYQNFGIEVKINEGSQKISSQFKEQDTFEPRSSMPHKSRLHDSFFISMDPMNKVNNVELEDTLIDRVSFDPSNIQSEVEQAIDTYSRRLTLTKQQLSLVEEESVQDIESVPSQKSSLTIEQSLEDFAIPKDNDQDLDKTNTYEVDIKRDDCKKLTQNFIGDTRTYNSFYDDFYTDSSHSYKMSSTVMNDCSSKDSGYPDSAANDKTYKVDYILPTSSFKKAKSACKIDQPKSLDSVSTNSDDKFCRKTYPSDKKSQWTEPLNHSRLLYKEFFLKKEGHSPHAPNNSPVKCNVENVSDSNITDNINNEHDKEHLNYPSYLLNSSTKAYTSKVIEDYKKELEAINNLHELTLKDIKTDAISPTPLDIDSMFEQHSKQAFTEQKCMNSQDSSSLIEVPSTENKFLQNNKRDVSKISTKELIDDYFKVKGDYKSDNIIKNLKKYDKKTYNVASYVEVGGLKQNWNNASKAKNGNSKCNLPINFRNQNHKNLFTMKAPLSARIGSVQMDKDVDSWMSLTSHSPRIENEISDSTIKATNETKGSAKTEMTNNDVPLKDGTIPATTTEANISKPKESTSNSPLLDKKITQSKELSSNSTVSDIYSMLKEIESYGDNPVTAVSGTVVGDTSESKNEESASLPKDSFLEIFEFLEKVEQSANDALSIVTNTTTQAAPKLEALLKLPQTELAQRLVTASLQLEERSCCIALLQESLANHKEQMINKVSNLEKQSVRNIAKVKQECEEAIKRHQSFIDQLINDKKTLNHRIEQLVDERRSLEERWKRSAQSLEERYKLELRNQHDKMAAAHQVARQRWVRQKAEKIKELTVKGLEGELREMAERQQKEIADLKMSHAEQTGRAHAKHAAELEELRRRMEEEREAALIKERQLSSSRLEKQILELELTYQEQRTRLVAELRAENERVASGLGEREREQREQIEKWREEQEKLIENRRLQLEQEIAKERENIELQLNQKREELEQKFEQYKKDFEAEQQLILKRKTAEISAQHKLERDREIEKAIDTMEAEAQAGRKELQEALRRHKEQYEAELRELGETEQATLRRYQEAQARVRHTEDRCAELEVMISQLESKNKVLTQKNSQLESQVGEVRASCQEEWQAKVEEARQEIENMKKTHEEQMHQLYAKVKVAVARKDSMIQAMTREAAKQQEKITLLEQKLQQQRKDFLKQK